MIQNREMVEKLLSELDIEVDSSQNSQETLSDSKIRGKSFCVTGSFDSYSRDQIHEMIEKNGGEVRTSVSLKLDYLIA